MKWEIAGHEYRQSTGERTKAKANDVLIAKREELLKRAHLEEYGIECFKERYEDEFLAGKSKTHINKFKGAIKKLIDLEGPEHVTDIDSQMIARYAKKMRKAEIAAATIVSYLGYLERAFNWAVQNGILIEAPNIEIPTIPDEGAAKGRPLLGEEIERMKGKAEAIVGKDAAPSYESMIDGLNVSGLRLGEAMLLSWPTKNMDDSKVIVQVGASVTLSIPAKSQKRKRRQVHPVTPDFADYLLSVPLGQRKGMIFNPLKRDGTRHHRVDTVSKRFSAMGEKAGIIVKTDSQTNKIVYASAQDLRRTYGLRWAGRVLPQDLKRLMRHRTIETTMKYYATQDAERLSLELSERFGEQVSKEHSERVL